MNRSEFQESLDQYVAFGSVLTRLVPTGERLTEPGLVLTYGDMAWPLMNCAFVTAPAEAQADWERRAHRVLDYYGRKGRSYTLLSPEDWLTAPAQAALERAGFKPMMTVSGMVTDALAAPTRPMPPELTFRRVNDPESRTALGDINSICYAVPLEWGREITAHGAGLWSSGDFAFLGCVDGKPVTCSVASRFEDSLYVSWVATLPEYRRKGYAEAVMRQCLTEATRHHGLSRTVLHATPAGFPVYERMGYRGVARFVIHGGPAATR